jgi:hypothetical protein
MKKSEAKNYIKEIIISELSLEEGTYVGAAAITSLQKDPKFAAAKDKVTPVNTLKAGGSVTLENEEDDDVEFDVEPTATQIKANSSFAQLKFEYENVLKQMEAALNKYKSAEGSKKQQYVDELRNLTLQKKELKALINPSIDDED